MRHRPVKDLALASDHHAFRCIDYYRTVLHAGRRAGDFRIDPGKKRLVSGISALFAAKIHQLWPGDAQVVAGIHDHRFLQ